MSDGRFMAFVRGAAFGFLFFHLYFEVIKFIKYLRLLFRSMAHVNYNGTLHVLVCDGRPAGLHENSSYAPCSVTKTVDSFLTQLGRGTFTFEITRVDDMSGALQEISSQRNLQRIPHYALLVWGGQHITYDSGGMKIQDVKTIEPYLPQLVYGPQMPPEVLEKAMRRGVRYFANNQNRLYEHLSHIFWQPDNLLKNLALVKAGGSSFDFDRQNKKAYNLRQALQALASIREAKPRTKSAPKQKIILTVGAGQYGDIVKDNRLKYADTESDFPLQMEAALQANIHMVNAHMQQIATELHSPRQKIHSLLQSEDFYFVTNDFANKVLLMTIAPHYILARDQIPLADSDTHTAALAHLYGAQRIVVIKRADAIYDFDPMRGFVLDQKTGGCADISAWRKTQTANRRHNIVTLEQMLSGAISREGTGTDGKADNSDGHLFETSALEYVSSSDRIKEIIIVPIAPEELHVHVGGNTYEHIVTGEQLTLDQRGWRGVLEQRLHAAFNGEGLSKIVQG